MAKLPFCRKARRWLIFSTMNPRSCPYEKDRCPACCGYYEAREASKYVLRKEGIIKSFADQAKKKP